MDEKQLKNMWNYFLSLEQDLSNTSRYVEPQGQENVYSFEFAKIIILACTEVESAFKLLCKEIDENEYGDIGKYKGVILGKYPSIVEAEVYISRLEKTAKPFEQWSTGPLSWWDDYCKIKHSRDSYFQNATYNNAMLALSALYILLLYLSKITGAKIDDCESNYISSEYASVFIIAKADKHLPGLESGEPLGAMSVNEETLQINIRPK